MNVKYISVEEVIRLHDRLLEMDGGLAGIRDYNLLCSAVEMPKAAFYGQEMHPSIFDKAAAYLFHIVQNHPFNDANKRTGAFTCLTFLELNRVDISYYNETSYKNLVLDVAKGKKLKEDIAKFLTLV